MDDVPIYYAWLEYCGRTQEVGCIVRSLSVTDLAWVNAAINRGISPKPDDGHDEWTPFPSSRVGDCDDYVVSKRSALIALGVPASSLTIVSGDLPNGEHHLVLEVLMNGETWVLDNLLTDEIYRPQARPYEWRETSRQANSGVIWSLAPQPSTQ